MRQQRIEKRWEPWREWSRIDELVKKRKGKGKKRMKRRPSWSVRGLGTGGRMVRADDDDGRCWYAKGLLWLLVLLLKL